MTQQSAQPGGTSAASTTIAVGRDNNGIIVRGDHAVVNVTFNDEHGSRVSDYRGPLPTPVRRDHISLLPRRGGSVIGRDQELADLQAALGSNGLIQLCGPAGIGKSALLRHAARTLGPGPDGVVYLHAGDREAAELAREIFKACYIAPDYVPSVVELQQHLEHLKLRIYVDDPQFSEVELKQLMDIVQNSALVFTTEQRITGTWVRTVPVGGLDESASINLLAFHLNRSLRDDERPAARALFAAANGSPLQLRRFAASSHGQAGLSAPKPLPSLLTALVRQQSPEARDVLHLIASVGGDDIAPVHLDALLGRGDSDRLCGELARTGLVVETDVGYRCPADVVDVVLKIRGVSYPTDKLCTYLIAWAAARATSPDAVADHHRILDALVLRAERDGRPDLGVALARAASPKLEKSLHFSAWGTLLGAGWSAAEAAKDKSAKAFFLNEEGVRNVVTGRLGLAAVLLAQAVLLWQELGALHKIQAAHQSAQFAASSSFPAIGSNAHNPAAAVTQAHTHMAAMASHHAIQAVPALPAVHAVPVLPAVTPPPAVAPMTPVTPHATLVHRPPFHMPGSGVVTPAHGVGHVANAMHQPRQVIDLGKHIPPHPAPTGQVHPVHHHQHHQHIVKAHHGVKAGAGGHGVASTAVAKTVTAVVISAGVFGGAALVNHLVNSPSSQASDPSCQSAVPAIRDAIAVYNTDIAPFQGQSNPTPSDVSGLIGDLTNVESAVQAAQSAAEASTITSALGEMSTSAEEQSTMIQNYVNGSTSSFDTTSLIGGFNGPWSQVLGACGE